MMRNSIVKIALIATFLPFTGLLFVHSAEAATLSNAKDTISNSRPSASAWLNADYAATDTIATITNNGSRYLASDSAQLIHNTGTPLGSPLTIASQSADLTTVYLAGSSGTAAGRYADILISPRTAKHTINFTTVNTVPVGGKITLTFPGSGSNIASPSATTFSFNGLASGNISYSPSIGTSTCGSFSIAAPTITCTIATAPLNAGTTVTLTIGSSTPTLINPTKSAVTGTDDSWTLVAQTTDSGGTVIDNARLAIGTIESVKVTADVDPSITFTIAPISSGNFNTVAGCTGGDTITGAGTTTATEVSLGFLRNNVINIAGQKLTVATNGSSGYVISATSSGTMLNPATGYWLHGANADSALTANDTPVPAGITAGTEAFGISACGAAVNTSLWGNPTTCTTGAGTCKYSNPWNTGTNSYYASIASFNGPVNNTDSNANTAIKYAGTVTATTPPGTYRTIFTYVATATF